MKRFCSLQPFQKLLHFPSPQFSFHFLPFFISIPLFLTTSPTSPPIFSHFSFDDFSLFYFLFSFSFLFLILSLFLPSLLWLSCCRLFLFPLFFLSTILSTYNSFSLLLKFSHLWITVTLKGSFSPPLFLVSRSLVPIWNKKLFMSIT